MVLNTHPSIRVVDVFDFLLLGDAELLKCATIIVSKAGLQALQPIADRAGGLLSLLLLRLLQLLLRPLLRLRLRRNRLKLGALRRS